MKTFLKKKKKEGVGGDQVFWSQLRFDQIQHETYSIRQTLTFVMEVNAQKLRVRSLMITFIRFAIFSLPVHCAYSPWPHFQQQRMVSFHARAVQNDMDAYFICLCMYGEKLYTAHLEIFGSKEDHKWQFFLCVLVIRNANKCVCLGACVGVRTCVCVLVSE